MARTKQKVGTAKPRTGAAWEKNSEDEYGTRILRSFVQPKKRKSVENGMEQQILDQVLGKMTQETQLNGGTIGVSPGDHTRVEPSDESIEPETTKQNAHFKCRTNGDEQSDLSSDSHCPRWNELQPKINELVQQSLAKITGLQREIDAAWIAMQAEKAECDVKLARMEEKMLSVARQRDDAGTALVREVSKANIVREEKLELEKAIMALYHRKCNVDRHLLDMWEKVKNLTKSEQACKNELEQARSDFEVERANLVANLAQAGKEKVTLETELVSVRADRDRLQTKLSSVHEDKRRLQLCLESALQDVENEKEAAVKENITLSAELVSTREEKKQLQCSLEQTIRSLEEERDRTIRNLEEERDRTLCQVCLESCKNTICFPCLHFQYCFHCLDKHRKRSNTCPSCRTSISGILRCDIGT